MASARWVLILFLVVGFGIGAFVMLRTDGGLPSGVANGESQHRNWKNTDCRACHEEVYAEWEASWHHQAYVDPLYKKLTNNYADKSCDDCHIPRNIPEVGFGPRTLARASDRQSGINCLSCHYDGQRIVAVRANPDAGCQPIEAAPLGTEMACIGCHNQHKLHEEWRKTPFFEQGIDCIDCHMPKVKRMRDGREVVGRHHGFISSRNRDFSKTPVEIVVKGPADPGGSEGKLAISITNVASGHNFPSDSRFKAADLITTFHTDGGETVGERMVERFHNPLRQALDQTNTQLPYGVRRDFEYDVPEGAGYAKIVLLFRIMKTDPDGDAHTLFERVVKW